MTKTRRLYGQGSRRRAGHDLCVRQTFLKNYKKIITLVGLGVLVETLFNVIMPLSLKFLIDDALGEEDFEALVKILSVLAVAGIITSIVAVMYERWDAMLSASLISDLRSRLFEHVQNLPAAYSPAPSAAKFSRASRSICRPSKARSRVFQQRGAAVLRIDRRHHSDAVPELAARRRGAAGVPITLIGPRILTPKAVQANTNRSSMNRRCSGWCRRTSRRKPSSRRLACSAAR